MISATGRTAQRTPPACARCILFSSGSSASLSAGLPGNFAPVEAGRGREWLFVLSCNRGLLGRTHSRHSQDLQAGLRLSDRCRQRHAQIQPLNHHRSLIWLRAPPHLTAGDAATRTVRITMVALLLALDAVWLLILLRVLHLFGLSANQGDRAAAASTKQQCWKVLCCPRQSAAGQNAGEASTRAPIAHSLCVRSGPVTARQPDPRAPYAHTDRALRQQRACWRG